MTLADANMPENITATLIIRNTAIRNDSVLVSRPSDVRSDNADFSRAIDALEADTNAIEALIALDQAEKDFTHRSQNEIAPLRDEVIRLGTEKSVPPSTADTPFREEHTYNLMAKRLLRMASEEGYDRLS